MRREKLPGRDGHGVPIVNGPRKGCHVPLADRAVERFEQEQRAARRAIRQARNGHGAAITATKRTYAATAKVAHQKLTSLGRLEYAITSPDLSDSQRDRMVAAILAGR